MPIANIPSANSPNVGSYTLLIGEDIPLYFTATGAIATTGAQAVFGVPPQSSVWRGNMWLEAVSVGATGGTGALTVNLEGSFDGGTTFQTIATGIALFTAGAGTIQKIDISGLGGCGQLRLNATTATKGTSTGFNVYAHLG